MAEGCGVVRRSLRHEEGGARKERRKRRPHILRQRAVPDEKDRTTALKMLLICLIAHPTRIDLIRKRMISVGEANMDTNLYL